MRRASPLVPPPPRRGYETEFLPAALEILATPASPTARLTAATIAALFVTALAWSILGHVDVVATAPGTIVPAGKVKEIQPLGPGIVKAILVADGDHVVAGQVLIRLDATEAAAERDRVSGDLLEARLNVAELEALRRGLDGASLDFMPPVGATADQVNVARATMAARRDAQRAKLAGLEEQLAEKRAEISENDATVAKLMADKPLLKQKRNIYRALLHNRFVNRIAWLDAERDYDDVVHDLVIQRQRSAELTASELEVVRQLREQRAAYDQGIMQDLAQARQKAAELQDQLAAATHRVTESTLVAPISGTVQQLAIHTTGGVVTPAQRLLVVVPDNAPVLIEATIGNGDIGFVHVGQVADIKVATFPYARYGLLHGRVVDVSRDAVQQGGAVGGSPPAMPGAEGAGAKPEPFDGYVVYIAPDRAFLDVGGHRRRLDPGMAVTADIKTGRRRLITYLLSPLRRYAHDAMRER